MVITFHFQTVFHDDFDLRKHLLALRKGETPPFQAKGGVIRNLRGDGPWVGFDKHGYFLYYIDPRFLVHNDEDDLIVCVLAYILFAHYVSLTVLPTRI